MAENGIITFLKRLTSPNAPSVGKVSLYAKDDDNLYLQDSNGNEKTLALLQVVYPVGSIYMSVVSTNPATLFGFGTWVAWGAGRVPVGVDTGQTEFDTVEETGGSKTHQLTESEMPSHYHTVNSFLTDTGSGAGGIQRASIAVEDLSYNTAGNTNSKGGNQAHNNLQPYITCYMWKRTA